jgi:DNA-binding GntR family transcriptional regulator
MTLSDAIQLDRLRQAAPQLYDRLRTLIITLALPPGTALSRSELAARFGVSQTPVRDALMRLQEEGLVEIFPQAATLVSKIDLGKARRAHFLRRSIEAEMMLELAAKPDPALVQTLRDILEQQRVLAGEEDFEGFAEADQAFHRTLYEAAGLTELWQLVRARSGHIDRLRRLHLPAGGKAQRVLADHARIVDAIAAGDALEAQRQLRGHLSGTLAQADEIRARHPDYFAN